YNPPASRPPTARDIPYDDQELTASGRFGPATLHRYEWEVPYSTAEYLDLLLTYPSHRALPAARRPGRLDCAATETATGHGGRIVERYLAELRIARRTA